MRKLDIVDPQTRAKEMRENGELPFYPRCPQCSRGMETEVPRRSITKAKELCPECAELRNVAKLSGKKIDALFLDEDDRITDAILEQLMNAQITALENTFLEALEDTKRFGNLPNAEVSIEETDTDRPIHSPWKKKAKETKPVTAGKRNLEL